MNTILSLLIGIPAVEIFVMIKIGQNIGAFNTILLIFLTAIVGIYFAKAQGLNTLRSGILNMYKNEMPLFEIISGASIALAACLLIFPGFVTDALGFFLLIPWTRKIKPTVLRAPMFWPILIIKNISMAGMAIKNNKSVFIWRFPNYINNVYLSINE